MITTNKDICKSFSFSLVSFIVRYIDSVIDSIGTFVQKTKKGCLIPKRDIVKSPISFEFHGKQEAVGKIFLAESYITKFNATFFIKIYTVLS